MALVVELDAVAVADAVQVKIVSHDVPGLTGLRGVVSRSVLAKRTLDETRETPGHAQPDAGGSPLSVLAELGQALSYLAGGDVSIFSATVASAPEFLRNATSELTALAKDKVYFFKISFSKVTKGFRIIEGKKNMLQWCVLLLQS